MVTEKIVKISKERVHPSCEVTHEGVALLFRQSAWCNVLANSHPFRWNYGTPPNHDYNVFIYIFCLWVYAAESPPQATHALGGGGALQRVPNLGDLHLAHTAWLPVSLLAVPVLASPAAPVAPGAHARSQCV